MASLNLPAADAVVIGAGPNGLAAAIVLAQAGYSVTVAEAEPTVGGGARSAELTLPGFLHDVCSAIHPLAVSSPFFRTLPLAEHGLEWIQPECPLAHPLDDGSAIVLHRSVERTAAQFGRDAQAYHELFAPLVESWNTLQSDILGPLRLPRDPAGLAAFGVNALRSLTTLARMHFREERVPALLAGMAGHSMLPLDKAATAAFALVLTAAGHAVGWPMPRGGSRRITDALAGYLRSIGGEIATGSRVESLDQLPRWRAVLADVTPRQLVQIAGAGLPLLYRRTLERYRYGPGAFKVDWALSAPIPWRAPECARAGTVHLGGTLEEIAASERAAWNGRPSERPFVLLAQPTLFDPSRAPAGRHIAWAYCHVPNGSHVDMLAHIESQIERFAPGFRDCIVARNVMPPAVLERHNANLIGGDINGGAQDIFQLFARPTARLYSTPVRGLYLCSSSTPPGGGVHGMCGYFAAKLAVRYLRKQVEV
ncbi:MAG: phytoene desaturase family protein [Terriglobales bacterium]